MKFYCIIRTLSDRRMPKKSYGLLKEACEKRGVEFIPIESEKMDLTNLPKLGKGDMLFRITTDTVSSNVAALLLNKDVATFYIDNESGSASLTSNGWTNTIMHKMHNLPIIPTITSLPKDKEILKKYVNHLGGFPIILKAQGGSHGVGVMRIDTIESLYSVSDFLLKMTSSSIAMRQYIDHYATARLIVVGDRVVDSIEYTSPAGDFRSNVGDKPIIEQKKYPKEVEEAAIKATHAIGHEFSGVDILLDRNHKDFYIAEVNHPCNYSRCQLLTGTDIAGAMVEHLMNKAKEK